MNITQRLYDTRLKMVSSDNNLNPSYFFQSIDLIRARKTNYPLYKLFYLKKNHPQIPYKMNYVIESNKIFTSKIFFLSFFLNFSKSLFSFLISCKYI